MSAYLLALSGVSYYVGRGHACTHNTGNYVLLGNIAFEPIASSCEIWMTYIGYNCDPKEVQCSGICRVLYLLPTFLGNCNQSCNWINALMLVFNKNNSTI